MTQQQKAEYAFCYFILLALLGGGAVYQCLKLIFRNLP